MNTVMDAAPPTEPQIQSTSIPIHTKFRELLYPHRYKIAHGGRGGLKSWQFARALLYHAAVRHERILCTREVQKSLKESVHQLLSDQILELGLGHLFQIQEAEIRGPHNSLFIFGGLSDQTVESIKSYEGVTKVWIEEARTVTKRSWGILIPTIRRPGSEIWVSFNPELETDETYVRFVTNPPEGAVVIETSYKDNPWLSYEMEQERIHCKATETPEVYANIWEGACLPAEVGAIFAEEVLRMTKEGRIGPMPYDPLLAVHCIWDFGWNDAMAVIMAQRRLSELRIIDYYEDRFKTIDETVVLLKERRYNWGYDFLPHDGYTRDVKSGKTIEDYLRAAGRKPLPLNVANPRQAVGTEEQTIRAARPVLRQTYIDKVKGQRLIECWKRYKRHLPKHGEPAAPIHDEFAHGAAATRYLPFALTRMTNVLGAEDADLAQARRTLGTVTRDPSLGGL